MSTISHLTLETGNRSVSAVRESVRNVLEERFGDDSSYLKVYEYEGNVAVTRGYDPSDVDSVDVPRIVATSFNDTVDGGHGSLFTRVGDQFVRSSDQIGSPAPQAGGRGSYLIDYFRINYGIAPRFGYDRTECIGTTTRVTADEDWNEILSIAENDFRNVDPARLREWAKGETEAIDEQDRETIVSLLEVDSLYRTACATLEYMYSRHHLERPDWVFDRLTDSDASRRGRAVRHVPALQPRTRERYEQFLQAIGTVDERTRALVACELWEPWPLEKDTPPDPSLVTALLELTEDPVPELRIGALMGAVKTWGRLQDAVADGTLESSEAFDGVVEPFYDAYESLLDDPDPRMRERTFRSTREPILDSRGGYALSQLDRVGFSKRWQIALRGIAVAAEDDTEICSDGSHLLSISFDGKPETVPTVNGETEAVPTLVEYAYNRRNQHYETVRKSLATLAEENPTAVLEALGPAISSLEHGTETTADVELLEALAAEYPDKVASAVEDLEALRDSDDEDKRRAAVRTLDHLMADDP